MEIQEVSDIVHCQTKIMECSLARKENTEVRTTILPFGCMVINKIHTRFWSFHSHFAFQQTFSVGGAR